MFYKVRIGLVFDLSYPDMVPIQLLKLFIHFPIPELNNQIKMNMSRWFISEAQLCLLPFVYSNRLNNSTLDSL